VTGKGSGSNFTFVGLENKSCSLVCQRVREWGNSGARGRENGAGKESE